jgi:ribosome biogenesis GTPase
VRNEEKELYCTLTGSMRYREEFPVVGDEVEITENPYGDSLIREIRPRRTMFCRPDRGGHADGFAKTLQVQPLVANIDYVFIITSLNQDFSINRIARYAAMAVSGGAIPVAVLTKADLCPDVEDMEAKTAALSRDLQVVSISSRTGYGMDRLRTYFRPGATIALLGSSGAGKSTLINTLAGREIMQTGGIREEDSKGRHTTTHRELIELDGVSFIDTPGLRELGMIDAQEGINSTFPILRNWSASVLFLTAHTAANRAARSGKPWRTERFPPTDGRCSAVWRKKTNGARSGRMRR